MAEQPCAELNAHGLSVDEVRSVIGADSLGYISLESMIAATSQPARRLCAACFTGTYPVPLPDVAGLGKDSLEQPELPFESGPVDPRLTVLPADGVTVLPAQTSGEFARQ